MNKGVVAISAFAGAGAALIMCLAFYFVVYKPAQSGNAAPVATPTQKPTPTLHDEIPNPDVDAADVRSISINTIYRGFFDAGDKCAKSYNEYFGNDDGFASPSSPCTIKMSFDRDGSAKRSIEIGRWDKTTKEKHTVEKTEASASMTEKQFNELAQTIVTNDAFKSWREGTMITVSNCSISVDHSGGTKTVMSNVDEKTTTYLKMIDAIKKTEKQLNWR
jgi:hypothetical protein